ncbi:unnamed protein product [Sphagnum compactum]
MDRMTKARRAKREPLNANLMKSQKEGDLPAPPDLQRHRPTERRYRQRLDQGLGVLAIFPERVATECIQIIKEVDVTGIQSWASAMPGCVELEHNCRRC